MVYKDGYLRLFAHGNCQIHLLLVLTLLFAAGCATIPKAEDMSASLRNIAEDYWNKRMEEKYEDTYRMEEKEGLPSFENYRNKVMRMKKIEIKSHSVRDLSVTGDKGTVNVQFDMKPPGLPFAIKSIPQIIKDSWVFKNGKWRHILR
jgi:hypothetical protein